MAALLAVKTAGFARDATTSAEAEPAVAAAPSVKPPVSMARCAPSPMPENAPAPEERGLLMQLRKRRLDIETEAAALHEREVVQAAAEAKLAARAQELGALQTRLEALETDRRKHESEEWTGLVHVYEAMKPREAATIFDALDMQVLLQVLDRMQDRRAAAVLAAMQPERARLATQMLAEMRVHAASESPPPSQGGADRRG